MNLGSPSEFSKHRVVALPRSVRYESWNDSSHEVFSPTAFPPLGAAA
jgi:hypothetical protein